MNLTLETKVNRNIHCLMNDSKFVQEPYVSATTSETIQQLIFDNNCICYFVK